MTNTLAINISGITVSPEEADTLESVCTNCVFSFEGRSQRTCPTITYLSVGRGVMSNRKLCVMVGNNNLTYFKEAIVKSNGKS